LSSREGCFGERPAQWIYEIAKQRTDLAFELVDPRDHPLPFFNEPKSPRLAAGQSRGGTALGRQARDTRRIDLVTPE
jgi:NAD(P)H-dependent FMN reductase